MDEIYPSRRTLASAAGNVRQETYPFEQWLITTRKGIIMQSVCTCDSLSSPVKLDNVEASSRDGSHQTIRCTICRYSAMLPDLPNKPDMLFHDNLLRIEHFTGVGIEFSALDALKLVEESKDPLRVAVADGWQSARADFPFAKSIAKPFDWTFTTSYRGTLLSRERHASIDSNQSKLTKILDQSENITTRKDESLSEETIESLTLDKGKLCLMVEKTDERIDIEKLKVRDEILFYDDVTLYEDELADHGVAKYSVKVRVMPKCLFVLARFYLRVDGVLARINDTRIYHELNKRYLLREYTNREAKLSSLDSLPMSTLIEPAELMNHLPIVESSFEKLIIPSAMR